MLKLHHLSDSRSQRILWLLAELEVDYQLCIHQRDAKTNLAPRSLQQVHPLGKAPVIEDDGVCLAESAAIIEYLCRHHGGERFLRVPDSDLYTEYSYWMHYSEGSLLPPMVMRLVFDTVAQAPMPFFAKPIIARAVGEVKKRFINPNMQCHIAFIEQHLAQNSWFLDDELSAVDFQMSFPLEALAATKAVSQESAIAAYVAKIHQRPAYQLALAKAGPYAYAPS